MSPKHSNCFLFIYFFNCLWFVISQPISMMENEIDEACDTCDTPELILPGKILDIRGVRSNHLTSLNSAMMTKFVHPLEETLIPSEDMEGTNSMAAAEDSTVYHKDSICMDNFDIMPRTDGLPGSRTLGAMPNFGGKLVPIRCIWPVAETWDSSVEITIRIWKSDWGFSCTTWNLTLKYALDQEISWTRVITVCPSMRRRILKIPPDAKQAVLILAGLMSRSPRFSLLWTYPDMPKPSDIGHNEEETTWSQLIVMAVYFAALIAIFLYAYLYEKRKRRRTGRTDEEQLQTEQEAFRRHSNPPRPRMSAFSRARARLRRQDKQTLLPKSTSFSTTFRLQPRPAEYPRSTFATSRERQRQQEEQPLLSQSE